MASSQDGKLIFLALNDCINVYESAEFSSKNPPEPSSFFPFNPLMILRPTLEQVCEIRSRMPNDPPAICFNHIRSGRVTKNQESLVAVGEHGLILVWDIKNIDIPPILMETCDFSSTWGIAMSHNNSLLAVSSNSHSVTIFYYPSKRVIYQVESSEKETESEKIHSHNIPSLDFSPCGRWLASCSIDGSVAVWSISSGIVTKMTLPANNEWGWLVRFISPHQYHDTPESKKVTKSFYHSTVEEIPQASPDDFDEEIYRNSQMALERLPNFLEIDEIESHLSFESEYEVDSSEDSSQELPRLTFYSTSDGAHLAEGADDSWPEYSDPDQIDDLGYTPYDSYDFSTSGSEDAYTFFTNDGENTGTYESSEPDNNVSDPNDNDSSNPSDMIDSSDLPLSSTCSQIEIKFTDIAADRGLSDQPCPYDLVYCTSTSLYIINSVTGAIKLSIPSLIGRCFYNQNEDEHSSDNVQVFLMNFLQNRLGMGEWIPELSVFLVIDCNGHLVILSPTRSSSNVTEFTSILLPDLLYISNQIIGYTVIRRLDEEFGVKVHVYLIHVDGTFRLYEIVRK